MKRRMPSLSLEKEDRIREADAGRLPPRRGLKAEGGARLDGLVPKLGAEETQRDVSLADRAETAEFESSTAIWA